MSTVTARLPTLRSALVVAAPVRTLTGFGPAIARASGAYMAGTARTGSAGRSRIAARKCAPADPAATPGTGGGGSIVAAAVSGTATCGALTPRRSSCTIPGVDPDELDGTRSAPFVVADDDPGTAPVADLEAPAARAAEVRDGVDVDAGSITDADGSADLDTRADDEAALPTVAAMALPNRVRGPIDVMGAPDIVVIRPFVARRTVAAARARAATGSSGCDRSVTARWANAAAIGSGGTGASARRDGIETVGAAVAAAVVVNGNGAADALVISPADIGSATVESGVISVGVVALIAL